MKLYFSPNSPYVRKCLVVAHELGLSSRIELLAGVAHPVNRDASLVAINPLGKIPALVTDEGVALYDSRVICEYLDALGGNRLFPAAGAARWSALTLQSLADGMLDAALLARYETAVRPEAFRWNEWTAGQIDKLHTSMAALQDMLAAGELDARIDIGTLAVGCALWYLDLRYADLNWRDRYPALAAWNAVISQRPSMQSTWSV